MYRIRDAYSIEETALAKADACPVVDIVETIAEKYNISTTLLCDTNHILYSDYSEQVAGFKDIHTGKDRRGNADKKSGRPRIF